jgi:hypothetical protein
MFAVKGIYDGKTVYIKDSVPIRKRCDVVVTFLETETQETPKAESIFRDPKDISREEKLAALNSIVGIIKDNTMTIEEAREERLARQ